MTLMVETNNPAWMTNAKLKQELQPLLPGVDIRYLPDLGERRDIEMLACVRLPAGLAKTLPNLRLVQKLGAGVEAIVGDPELVAHIQVARLKSAEPAQEIAEYCLTYVLQYQRQVRMYTQQEAHGQWAPIAPKRTGHTTIGMLGLGHIGARVANMFAGLGFKTIGWSRTKKQIAGVDCRAGTDTLLSVLAEADYIAAILPATALTRDLINTTALGVMKSTAVLINVGRGDLIVERDLLEALDQDRLAHAVLDVHRSEPLPAAHSFWSHPKITVTPHVSGWHVAGGPEVIAENYRRLKDDRPLLNLVDRQAGY